MRTARVLTVLLMLGGAALLMWRNWFSGPDTGYVPLALVAAGLVCSIIQIWLRESSAHVRKDSR
jgi:hypothetical protein